MHYNLYYIIAYKRQHISTKKVQQYSYIMHVGAIVFVLYRQKLRNIAGMRFSTETSKIMINCIIYVYILRVHQNNILYFATNRIRRNLLHRKDCGLVELYIYFNMQSICANNNDYTKIYRTNFT